VVKGGSIMDQTTKHFFITTAMLYTAIGAVVLLVMVTGARGETCEQCPPDKPCGYTQPSQDGCNMCSGETICKNGKWYTYGVTNCTAMGCIGGKEIPNPFEPAKDRPKALKKKVKKLSKPICFLYNNGTAKVVSCSDVSGNN
jgi:hypothetical protein